MDEMSIYNSDREALTDYLLGNSTELPANISKMVNNIIVKLSVGLGVDIMDSKARQNNLLNYVNEAERVLFNPENIPDMSHEELSKSYKQAKSTLDGMQEFERKYILQNKDVVKFDNSPQENLVNKLMLLSPDKVDKVLQMIDDFEKEDLPMLELPTVDESDNL